MDSRDLQPGTTLAGRYRIEDLVGEVAGSRSWRAVDIILNRSVGIEALPSSDPHSVAFLAAARQSTVVADPRFLRVLDAVANEGGVTYVVREWTKAVPLAVLLREGPLTSRRAATLCREVADAMARAHEIGVYHRCLNPATILVKETDAVRISGLATDQALRSSAKNESASDVAQAFHWERVDVSALGQMLYACLVARWPGGRAFGLAPAPTEHDRLLRPRQVRAGVSRDVDTVCDRILGEPPRHHGLPLRSARDIAAALALVGDDEALLADDPSSRTGEPTMAAPVPLAAPGWHAPPPVSPPPVPATPPRRRQGAQARTLVALGLALLLLMAAVLAFFIGRNSAGDGPDDNTATGGPSPSAAAPARPLPLRLASDFDPQGDLSEHPEEAAGAIDGDLETAWTTSQYTTNPRLGNLKNGVGLLVDLGGGKQATGIRVTFGDTPTNYEIWAAPRSTTDTPTQLTEMQQLESRKASRQVSSVQFDDPVPTRYLLVWLTSLPEESPGFYRGVIRDIRVEGTA